MRFGSPAIPGAGQLLHPPCALVCSLMWEHQYNVV